jgi:hypothetical protein
MFSHNHKNLNQIQEKTQIVLFSLKKKMKFNRWKRLRCYKF